MARSNFIAESWEFFEPTADTRPYLLGISISKIRWELDDLR